MFDQYTSLNQIINENPEVENILSKYGIFYDKYIEDNEFTLKSLSAIYGVNLQEIIREINGSVSSNNLF